MSDYGPALRLVLPMAAAIAAAGLSTCGSVLAEPIVEVGGQKQLFVDDFIVANKHNVTRELGKPVKQNGSEPVIVGDKPWEKFGTPIVGAVIREDGRFRIWYRAASGGADGSMFCYAESTDGVNWTKPSLGLVEYQGSRQNNIYQIGQPQAYVPFRDPNEMDPQNRYKSAIGTTRIDTALGYSPDALRWSFYHGGRAITGRASDTINQVVWDPYGKVYRLYTRTDFHAKGEAGEISGVRDMVAASDADLSDPRSWRIVRQWCLGWERGDKQYHRKRQIYSLNGWPYEGIQFALIWTIEGRRSVDPRASEEMDCYLATTRGTDMWNLDWVYADRPLIPRGKAGSFDSKWIQPAVSIVNWNDRHWLYYVGRSITHSGEPDTAREGPTAGIGLATLRLDGFVFLAAGGEPGTVVTKPFRLEGDALEVNVAADGGQIKVEVLDAGGEPVPGYSGETAQVCRNVDALRLRPNWEKKLSALKGDVVRLKFTLLNAKLYAFHVTSDQYSRQRRTEE